LILKKLFRKLAIFLILFTTIHGASAQGTSSLETWRNQIYEAYVLNNMPQWDRTLRAMEAAYSRNPTNELLYDLTLAQYGLIGYYLGNNENSKAEPLLEKAEKNREALAKTPAYAAAAHAFEAAFIGYRISLRPIRAVVIGPRSSRAADRAIEADARYARSYVEKGNIMFFAPAPFGNKSEAIKDYQKGIELMENNMHPSHRWLYLSTLVSLAGAYEKTGDLPRAIQTLEKALRFEPRFKWVKDDMLPKFRAQQAGN
jgi:tetratricopeptide (TPR) repeat protein